MPKREWGGVLNFIKGFSESGTRMQNIKRFSEAGEVENYGKEYNQRGDILARKFLKKKGAKILDVGCASGSVAFTLAGHGYNIDGIDISREMIKKANALKKRNKEKKISFKVGDAEFLNVKEKYDYVLALFNLLTLFPKRETRFKVLNNFVRALKKDGILITDTINGFGSLRLIFKQIFFKILFLLNGKNRPFGDVISNPQYSDSNEVLFQHFLSKKEIGSYLDKIPDIRYQIRYYDIFADKKSKRCMLLIVKKI